ncbi:hypothetical protein lpari_00075 [Legionella parisiensis]|uniref:Uncharacterized protein n=1 Tax=Legionella parisiensis TaxID=45071 RepID=A0A1E5JWS0_9GAMM|nr:hypothetical protein lpari_00075 [Legionella parisiensis]STX72325.1 Uncharacterised protein [Legionella parisiensis]
MILILYFICEMDSRLRGNDRSLEQNLLLLIIKTLVYKKTTMPQVILS